MISWADKFPSGSLAWMLLLTLLPVAFIGVGYFLTLSALLSTPRRMALLRSVPVLIAAVSLAWAMWGYTLAFGPSWGSIPDISDLPPRPMYVNFEEMRVAEDAIQDTTHLYGRGGLIGGLEFVGMQDIIPVAGTESVQFPVRRPYLHLPHPVNLCFRALSVFVAITPLWIVWGRRHSIVVVGGCSLIWVTLVFAPVAHWVWGDGYLERLGTIDFGGGLIYLAVACSVVGWLRPERSDPSDPDTTDTPADLFRPAIGALALWLGATMYFVAQTFQADGRAALTLVNMQLGLSACVLAWGGTNLFVWGREASYRLEWGVLAAVAGMAGAAGYLLPHSVILLGLMVGMLCNVLDHWAQHRSSPEWPLATSLGVGSIVGLVGAGLLATTAAAGNRWDHRPISGAIQGEFQQVLYQLAGIAAVAVWALLVSWVMRAVHSRLGRPEI